MKKTSLKAAILAAGLISSCFAASISVAADKASTTDAAIKPYTALVDKLSHGQLNVIRTTPGFNNLVGLVVTPKTGGPHFVMYADKDAKYAIYGSVFNTEGVDVTQQSMEKYVNPMIAKKAIAELNGLHAIKDGSKGPVLDVIIDPNCIWCNKLFNELRGPIDSGKLQVNWYLVGVIKPDSVAKSAAILNAKDPLTALKQDEKNFNVTTEEGGIEPLKKIPQAINDELAKNLEVMTKYGFNGTPVILFTNTQGQANYVAGFPKNLVSFLHSNLGVKLDTEK